MFKAEHETKDIILFGDFRLLKAQRRLERNGIAVALGGRALDILVVLTSRAGDVVSKNELMSLVWPNITVEESVLRAQLSILRRVLGDVAEDRRHIVNVTGRGYCFVAPVTYMKEVDTPTKHEGSSRLPDAMPAQPYNVIGREQDVAAICHQLIKSRFVSITGTGGIGKTTVAVCVGHRLRGQLADGVHFIDLAPVTDARFVIDALVSAFRQPAISGDPLPGLITFLQDKQLLLVLDSCEHVIEAAASLAERLFTSAPGVHILATSREPLRVLGEQVYRLLPLEAPPDGMALEVTSALTFPAVQLFVDRAQTSSDRFQLAERDVASVAEICRRLDGIPLAIQLAASRVDAFGVQGTAALLDEALSLFSNGRRTALPRHQTLGAALDWSYGLLAESERLTLRRLSVFVGNFTLAGAYDVAGGDDLSEDQIIDAISELVAKSLLVADISSKLTNYRFLDTTRGYAIKKLSETAEKDAVLRRHATYFLNLIAQQRPSPTAPLNFEDTAFFETHLPNIRAALDWSLLSSVDKNIAIKLTAASSFYFFERGLFAESRPRAERLIAGMDDVMVGSQHEMLLQMLLSYCLRNILGFVDDTRLAFERSIEIAENLEDWPFQLRMLSQLHLYYVAKCDFSSALKYAQQALSVAIKTENPEAAEQANTMLGNVYNNLGNNRLARQHYEAALSRMDMPGNKNETYSDVRDQNVALIGCSRTLWCLGFPDQGLQMTNRAIAHARSTGQQDALMIAISILTTTFILVGDIPAAAKCADELVAEGEKWAIKLFSALGNGFKGYLSIQRGDIANGCAMIQHCLDALNLWSLSAWNDHYICYLSEGLLAQGRLRDAFALIDAATELNTSQNHWFMMPEMLRIKGNIMAALPGTDFTAAETCFYRALEMAEEQAALSWALRVAISLAQLYRARARNDEALRLLAPVYDRFTEGFNTADLKLARQILDDLRQPSTAAGSNR